MLRLRTVSKAICWLRQPSSLIASSNKISSSTTGMPIRQTKAVIFDYGGVVVPGPITFFFDYENKLGLPRGSLIKQIATAGPNGAWQRLERGEISSSEFGKLFSDEYYTKSGSRADLTKMLDSFHSEYVLHVAPHPQMIDAILCLRAEGIKTALLTNNTALPGNLSRLPHDGRLFDVVVESAQLRMRKPEPRIYQYTLDQLKVAAQEAVFLDDIGENVKAARELGIRTIKVDGPDQAVAELEQQVGLPLRGYVDGTTSISERLRFPIDKFEQYMNQTLNLSSPDRPIVRCFAHGQSNPTYFVRYAGKDMVLRKKPPGKLLPSAHAIEREYKVMSALHDQGVPVPRMIALCPDESVIGTPFFLMDHVPGRIFKDPSLPGMSREERRDIYMAMCDVLVKLHKVNIKGAGLEDFGKQGDFVKRNFARWTKQYVATKTCELPAMDRLMAWLSQRMPITENSTIIHGDARLDNMIFHPTRPQVLAVIDWELSSLGDPIIDLSNNCLIYYIPKNFPIIAALDTSQLGELGIPTSSEYLEHYARQMGMTHGIDNWDFYMAFTFFRAAAILQGVYKRFTIGQASSPDAASSLEAMKVAAELGWNIASSSKMAPTVSKVAATMTPAADDRRHYSTSSSSDANAGNLPVSVSCLSPRAQDLHKRVKEFIAKHVIPLEEEFYKWSTDPVTKWTIHPKQGELKAKAKSKGLWNLFLPKETDHDLRYGAGLTNIEYAFMAEEMGRSSIAPEVFNCSAPDTGNMEVLVRYGTEEQKEKWLKPLLDGTIRSCFAMTEPAVASSDATNIESSIIRSGDNYIINGHKWWTSGAMDPRCKLCIFMGKTNPKARSHQQQSMIIVPMDAPGVKILRPLTVFGYDDAPHGHAEVLFENVRVPVSNILLGEGRGFEIAQGRLGPGRIHHCMRCIGSAERALQLMVDRVQKRVAFGKPLIEHSSIQQDIARSRIEIEQSRLLVLKSAHLMDTVGNKAAAAEIAMIKATVPSVTAGIIDRAIQAHGGMGVCQDLSLAQFFAWSRILRIADGPDEVHLRAIAKMELRAKNSSSSKL